MFPPVTMIEQISRDLCWFFFPNTMIKRSKSMMTSMIKEILSLSFVFSSFSLRLLFSERARSSVSTEKRRLPLFFSRFLLFFVSMNLWTRFFRELFDFSSKRQSSKTTFKQTFLNHLSTGLFSASEEIWLKPLFFTSILLDWNVWKIFESIVKSFSIKLSDFEKKNGSTV